MISLRRADVRDWARLYAWRTDPTVQSNSMNSAEFTIQEHMAWLKAVSDDPDKRVYVIENAGEGLVLVGHKRAIGVGRLSNHSDVVEFSIALSPDERGRGYATAAVKALCVAARREFPAAEVGEATVAAGNTASLRSFAAAGFEPKAFIRKPDCDGGTQWIVLAVALKE